MTDPQVREQARYIFTASKVLRRYIFSFLSKMEQSFRLSGELSVAQLNLLMAVRSQPAITVSGLAAALGVSPPSVSVMVDRLVERGLLSRERSRVDRRKVVLRVSPKEEQRLEAIEDQMLAAFIDLVEAVGPETARKWGEVLRRVEEVLDRRDKKPSSAPR